METVPSIFEKFKLHVKTTGASMLKGDETPLYETSERDLPFLKMALRARANNRLLGQANGYRSKIKWGIKRSYGKRDPGTPVDWNRRGSLEFMSTHYCHEFDSMQFIESEVSHQLGDQVTWSADAQAQQFDDVYQNMLQDFHADMAESIEETMRAVPGPAMEEARRNTTRSCLAFLNEWQEGHGVHADGFLPGYTKLQNFDPKSNNEARMAATVQTYSEIGEVDGLKPGHLFEAFMTGARRVNFQAYPEPAGGVVKEMEGHLEAMSSIKGIETATRTLAAHHHVVAQQGSGVFSIDTRIKGIRLVDVEGMEDIAYLPSYDANGDPDGVAAAKYKPNAEEQEYFTEMNCPNAIGPRFILPFQKHIRPIWNPAHFFKMSPTYALEESVPDAMVKHVQNWRNVYTESFRRHLVIRPSKSIPVSAAA